MDECSHEYDDKLDLINHYKLYPEMKVWVGCNYSKNPTKLLLIGESHYLNKESEYHLDPKIWYAGVEVSEKIDCKNIKTRNIIYNGIKTKWQLKSKTIFRNIEKALFESLFFENKPLTAFTEVAFMNYFQRPAEKTGQSINVSAIDAEVSSFVFQSVVNAVEANIIIFTSSLAWQHAKNYGIRDFLNKKNIKVGRAPHPGMPWWSRSSKAYGNQTGKEHFIQLMNRHSGDFRMEQT